MSVYVNGKERQRRKNLVQNGNEENNVLIQPPIFSWREFLIVLFIFHLKDQQITRWHWGCWNDFNTLFLLVGLIKLWLLAQVEDYLLALWSQQKLVWRILEIEMNTSLIGWWWQVLIIFYDIWNKSCPYIIMDKFLHTIFF